MTKSSLNPGQCRLVEIIEALGFGAIERLSISEGMPSYDPEPRIVQAIKLAFGVEPPMDRSCGGTFTLKTEFGNLFDQLNRLRNGVVDIEVQHSMPFRLVLARRYAEFL